MVKCPYCKKEFAETIEDMPECPLCKSNKNVIKVYRPEIYEFKYICDTCDQGFN